ncbi:MAG: metallophosphatase family protein [Acidobacteria bacterium]|nr:metallophosphatase family protein [Acidobacteriota bacterium]
MRIALISDLHANEVALNAVLNNINRAGVDQIVCLGDVATLGPLPRSVIQTLRNLECLCILGNHDEFLINPELIHTYTEIPVIIEAVDWCRSQLSGEELGFIRTFQPGAEILLDERSKLLLFHGSPRSHMVDILSTTPPDELDQLLAGHQATVMAGGHTHIQMLRQHRGMLIVNPGSVGLPFKEYVAGRAPTVMSYAEYAIVEAVNGEISVNLRRVSLDKSALRESVRACDNPLRGMLLEQYN